jgi:hypothetical protein
MSPEAELSFYILKICIMRWREICYCKTFFTDGLKILPPIKTVYSPQTHELLNLHFVICALKGSVWHDSDSFLESLFRNLVLFHADGSREKLVGTLFCGHCSNSHEARILGSGESWTGEWLWLGLLWAPSISPTQHPRGTSKMLLLPGGWGMTARVMVAVRLWLRGPLRWLRTPWADTGAGGYWHWAALKEIMSRHRSK